MVQLATAIPTKRLLLRRMSADDLEPMRDLHARADVARYLYNEPRSAEEVAALLERRLAAPPAASETEENRLFVSVDLIDGPFIGEFMLRWPPNGHRCGEVGGVLHPRYHGHGYATEIYGALLALGFTVYGLHRIQAQCDARNVASVRSLERAGLTLEGRLRENEFVKGEWTDELVFGILAADWQQGQPTSTVAGTQSPAPPPVL
jgi:RimJ/RimL family protein N-acetyltransferase